jgi:hypothetical protein
MVPAGSIGITVPLIVVISNGKYVFILENNYLRGYNQRAAPLKQFLPISHGGIQNMCFVVPAYVATILRARLQAVA